MDRKGELHDMSDTECVSLGRKIGELSARQQRLVLEGIIGQHDEARMLHGRNEEFVASDYLMRPTIEALERIEHTRRLQSSRPNEPQMQG